jgi:antitoxin component YwqK of YwqJK toxin-antitoxin module
MKLIIAILLLTIGTFAQNTTYKDGTDCECDSINSIYCESGELWRETPYTNGKINGIVKVYYESGELMWEIPYTNDKKNGIEKKYYASGKLAGTATYKNGELVGYTKCTDGRFGNEELNCLIK